jgi:acetyl esterase/lipase
MERMILMLNKKIKIWDDVKTDKAYNDDFDPILETYILSGNKKRAAVLICPGGGYAYTSEREAEPIAMQFNANGYHAFVLNYSVAPRRHPQPILDCSRAMCLIRSNAEEWNIDSFKIAVCGFSAGAHLAASLGVHWNKPLLDVSGIHIGMNKPDALILAYPVISMKNYCHIGSRENLLGKNPEINLVEEMSLETQVSRNTPPSFIWHTVEDVAVPVENSLMFASALRKEKIPFELHVYTKGPHGLSLATEETDVAKNGSFPHIAGWVKLSIEWLEEIFTPQSFFSL